MEKDYHHIFDSETGFPVETDLASPNDCLLINPLMVRYGQHAFRGTKPASILWQVEI